MNTYITIPLRYLRGRMTRTILTTLAIVFGVLQIVVWILVLAGGFKFMNFPIRHA